MSGYRAERFPPLPSPVPAPVRKRIDYVRYPEEALSHDQGGFGTAIHSASEVGASRWPCY